jgi:oligopeptide transport system ATP-binding protein
MEVTKNETTQNPILSAKDIEIQFSLRGRLLTAIRKCSMDLYEGEALAIVGESGSGKSVFTKSFIGMLDANGSIIGGSIMYDGIDISKYRTEAQWLTIRGKRISMVMQDPMTSLNPLKKVGKQIQESIEYHQGLKGDAAKKKAVEMLDMVGIPNPESRYNQYPHEFSGGMRQRVVIAIAVACHPQILICDEPTTALDVTIQAQILKLIKTLQSELKMTVIYITHDLGVVANVADRIAVMYAGDIVEVGTSHEVFYTPQHPYTWALLSSLPQLGIKGQALYSIAGTPPNLFLPIRGDAFAPRNPHALAIDFKHRPPYFDVTPTHKARTWLLDPRAPKIEPPDHIQKLRQRRAGGDKV